MGGNVDVPRKTLLKETVEMKKRSRMEGYWREIER